MEDDEWEGRVMRGRSPERERRIFGRKKPVCLKRQGAGAAGQRGNPASLQKKGNGTIAGCGANAVMYNGEETGMHSIHGGGPTAAGAPSS